MLFINKTDILHFQQLMEKNTNIGKCYNLQVDTDEALNDKKKFSLLLGNQFNLIDLTTVNA